MEAAYDALAAEWDNGAAKIIREATLAEDACRTSRLASGAASSATTHRHLNPSDQLTPRPPRGGPWGSLCRWKGVVVVGKAPQPGRWSRRRPRVGRDGGRKIPHYGKHSYLVLMKGKRGEGIVEVRATPLRVNLRGSR
jgi:hypothetical protein